MNEWMWSKWRILVNIYNNKKIYTGGVAGLQSTEWKDVSGVHCGGIRVLY